jgi:hypothetical protein
MARVKLAPIISDLSGKLENTVFTMGRSVLALRTRVKPFNPQTSYQTAVRALFANWTAKFRALTAQQITDWNKFALTLKKANVFGVPYHSTGHKMYVAYNTENSLYGSGVEIASPLTPVFSTSIGVSAMDFDATLGHATVTTDNAVPANTKLYIYASGQLSAGVSNAKGKLVHIKTFPGGTAAGDLDVKTEYEAHFGSLIKDQKVFVQCYLSNTHATLMFTKHKNGAELCGKVK